MKRIRIGLEFPEGSYPVWAKKLLELPEKLRPTHYSFSERGKRKPIGDPAEFLASLPKLELTPFLFRKGCGYFDIGYRRGADMFYADLSVPLPLVEYFMTEMADLQPIFGYACAWEERLTRNRIYKRWDAGSTESWVGRDPTKYIPGLYWMTLLPDKLARQHGVALKAVESIALHHAELPGGNHLFRFYERPEDWAADTHVKAAISALPGLFDIEKIKLQVDAARTHAELDDVLRNWR